MITVGSPAGRARAAAAGNKAAASRMRVQRRMALSRVSTGVQSQVNRGACPAPRAPRGSPCAMAQQAKIVGQCEVLRTLGRGGMAVVHLARQAELDRFV